MWLILLQLVSIVNGLCSNYNPCSFTGGDILKQPKQLISSNGFLSMTYTVRVSNITVEWLSLARRTYHGEIPSATWRIKRGDIVNVTVVNTLGPHQKREKQNEFRFPNTTSIHTHGLHISSKDPQDNVFVHIEPGTKYTYSYKVHPKNPSGTYWYHAHVHGSTLFQVQGGMAGMIIVEDEYHETPAHLWAVSCPDNCQHDIQLVFQPLLGFSSQVRFQVIQQAIKDDPLFRLSRYNITTGGNLEQWLAKRVGNFTTNGQIWPKYNMETGQIKRFRMLNAGGNDFLSIVILDQHNKPASGCLVKVIAYDGVYLDQAVEHTNNISLLSPAGRVDWLVVCNNPGVYQLRSIPLTNKQSKSTGVINVYEGLLLTIVVSGPTTSINIGTALPKRPYFVRNFMNISEDKIKSRFVLEVNPSLQLNRESFSRSNYYRYKTKVNSVQEWYLINTDPLDSHPIHIHVNHFQVISYNEYTGGYGVMSKDKHLVMFNQSSEKCYYQNQHYTGHEQYKLPVEPLKYLGHDTRWKEGGPNAVGYADAGVFRDTLMVQPLANITIRFLTDEFTGEVVIHCHILAHEDNGMMMTVYIEDEKDTNVTAHLPSGNAYPGTCNKGDVYPFHPSSLTIRSSNRIFDWLGAVFMHLACIVRFSDTSLGHASLFFGVLFLFVLLLMKIVQRTRLRNTRAV